MVTELRRRTLARLPDGGPALGPTAPRRRPLAQALPRGVSAEGQAEFTRRLQPRLHVNEVSVTIEIEERHPALVRVASGEGESLGGRHVGNPDHECVRVELSLDLAHIRPKLGTNGTGDIMNLHDRRNAPANDIKVVEPLGTSALERDQTKDCNDCTRQDHSADHEPSGPSFLSSGGPRLRSAQVPVGIATAGAAVSFLCHGASKDRFFGTLRLLKLQNLIR